jgi:hypothetical protein
MIEFKLLSDLCIYVHSLLVLVGIIPFVFSDLEIVYIILYTWHTGYMKFLIILINDSYYYY